ncbi:hypothetical protein DB354_03790 [Opitutus sp. ER46]|nr:hypothetical protein DB354_03790 [Opitutus sp. ER46]
MKQDQGRVGHEEARRGRIIVPMLGWIFVFIRVYSWLVPSGFHLSNLRLHIEWVLPSDFSDEDRMGAALEVITFKGLRFGLLI